MEGSGANQNRQIPMAIKLQYLLLENFQLAMKVYGDKLSPEDVEFLTKLCGRDYTFKTMADLLIQNKEWGDAGWKDKKWKDALDQIRNYHKNVFPIIDFDYDSVQPVVTKQMMENRANIIRVFSTWPKIAKRNLRKDIAQPRSASGFSRLINRVEYIDAHLHYLDGRNEETKDAIFKKIFSSDHPTFEEVLDFVEDKQNLLQGGKAYSKEGLYKLVEKYDYDLNIVYDNGNVVVVDVTGQPGIKVIGCNSLWCFTHGTEYGRAGEQWDQYSHNGHVYAIINFKMEQTDPDFIHILTKPFEQSSEDEVYLYNMANEQQYGDPKNIIVWIAGGDTSILSVFKWEDF